MRLLRRLRRKVGRGERQERVRGRGCMSRRYAVYEFRMMSFMCAWGKSGKGRHQFLLGILIREKCYLTLVL